MTQSNVFNPNDHLISLKGGRPYLPVQWRLVWFREQYPHGSIKTELVQLDLEKSVAIFKAEVSDGEGGFATGHGSESAKDFPDYLEKAETKACGRALAALGFGTQFAPELDEEHRIVDSPAIAPQRPTARQANGTSSQPNEEPLAALDGDIEDLRRQFEALYPDRSDIWQVACKNALGGEPSHYLQEHFVRLSGYLQRCKANVAKRKNGDAA